MLPKLFFLIDKIEEFKNELYEYSKSPKSFVHYTKPSVTKSLIRDTDKKLFFRLYCTKYMNDPDEGEILFTINNNLNNNLLKKFYENEGSEEDNSLTFIGSFIDGKKGKDKLPLWRLYGKGDDGKEARGMCIELDKNFFDHNKEIQLENKLALSKKFNKKDNEKNINAELIFNIYPVLYFEKNNEDEENKLISDLLNNVEESLKDIWDLHCESSKNNLNKNNKKHVKIVIRAIFDEIRYLVKSIHYKEEHEYRVVISHIKNDDEKIIIIDDSGECPKFYINTNKNFKEHIQEIIIGPAVKYKNEWKFYFNNKNKNINIKFSECKFK